MKVSAKIFLAMFIIGGCGTAQAFDANEFASDWNVPSNWSVCNQTDAKDALIGREKTVCDGFYDGSETCWVSGNRFSHGLSMMVARNINANGVYLCPTAIGGDKVGGWQWGNINENKPYATVYYETPAVDSSNCVWLCKSGYHGDGCTQTSYNGCNAETLLRSNYDSGDFSINKASQNVEDDVAMFAIGVKNECGKKSKSPFEHDVIMGISEWLTSGHGAWVQPFVVRANYVKYSEGPGYAQVYAIGTPTLVCRSGYVVNSLVNDCVPVDADACNLSQSLENGNICNNFNFADYSAATMEYFYNDSCTSSAGSGGWAFKCKDAGYGFQSENSKVCVECPASALNGISPDGVCIRCSVGSVFDENAATTNYCVTATALSRDDLKFGPNKSSTTLLSDQCWTKSDSDDYADCVWGTLSVSGKTVVGYQVASGSGNVGTIPNLPGGGFTFSGGLINNGGNTGNSGGAQPFQPGTGGGSTGNSGGAQPLQPGNGAGTGGDTPNTAGGMIMNVIN